LNPYMLDDWTKNDAPTFGTDLFWVRLRLTGAVTTLPVIEQFKLHTSRSEKEADGTDTYYGAGRQLQPLPWDWGITEAAVQSPADMDLYVSDNLVVGRVENSFNNGVTDQQGFNTILPKDLDTSYPITVGFEMIGTDGDAVDADFTVRWGFTNEGSRVYRNTTDAPTTGPNEQSVVMPVTMPATEDTLRFAEVSLDISAMNARPETGRGDRLWVSIERDGGGDAYGGNVGMININAEYLSWCGGGHL